MGIEEKKKSVVRVAGKGVDLSVCGIVKMCLKLYYKLALWITVIYDVSLSRDVV